jgi:hypothetical protein
MDRFLSDGRLPDRQKAPRSNDKDIVYGERGGFFQMKHLICVTGSGEAGPSYRCQLTSTICNKISRE